MKAKQRNHGKAIRWSETRSGKKHVARILWLKRSMAILSLAQTQAEIRVIASASLKDARDSFRYEKSLAIGQALIGGGMSAVNAYNSIQVKTL